MKRMSELHSGMMAPIEFSVKLSENDIARLHDEVRSMRQRNYRLT